MTYTGEYQPKKFDVTVSSGTGSKTFISHGNAEAMAIKVPSGTPTYDVEILDDDGFPITGKAGNAGNCRIDKEFRLFQGYTLYLTNVSADGTYTVKIWFKDA